MPNSEGKAVQSDQEDKTVRSFPVRLRFGVGLIAVIGLAAYDSQPIGVFLSAIGPAIAALATIYIAWFTLELRNSTDKLWGASREQMKLARSEFLATHRPDLVVRSFLFTKLPDAPDDTSLTDTYQITFWIANRGRSPASLISSRFQTFFGLTGLVPGRNELLLNPLAPWNDARATIAPGANIQHDVTGQASSVRLAAIDMGMDKTDLYFLGRIVYEDSEGTRREIGFGRQYNIKTGASAILTDPAIEYSD
ncbi:MAG: hypothetical protein ACYC1I_12965 [Acidimicrobiales bacterium]